MPTYEWKCTNCGKVQEVINKPADYNKEPEEACCDNPSRHKFFSKAPEGAKGPNWGAGKGNW